MSVRGAIFDLDGTLLDSMPVWDTLGERYLRSIGMAPEQDLGGRLRTMSMPQAAEYLKEQYGLVQDEKKIIEDINRLIRSFYEREAEVKPGVREALAAFEMHGVRMCVATANDRELAEKALSRNGVSRYFAEIVSCTEVGIGKDDPAFFEETLRRLRAKKEETIVFEDAPHAAHTAKRAGFRVAGVYDAAAETERETMKRICDWYMLRMDDENFMNRLF